MAVLHLTAFPEQRVSLVEEQKHSALLRGIEDLAQILLGLADILADDRREIDAIHIQAQLMSNHLGAQRFTRAALASE